MKTLIFAYKGHLGSFTDLENGKFINNPKEPGQLGCVISTKEALINKEAAEMLRNAAREGGSFASIMLTKHSDGSGSSIGLLGGGKMYFGEKIEIGRTCDKSIINDIEIDETIVPEDFKAFIDKK